MIRTSVALIVVAAGVSQDAPISGPLDGSGAFFRALDPDSERVLATTTAGPIDAATLAHYAVARAGRRELAELAFDLILERECAARGLARSAPMLARSIAARRVLASGRTGEVARDSDLRRRFANDALRQQRVDALVKADRRIGDATVEALFARRYGAGGVHVALRHVLVSFREIERELHARGDAADRASVRRTAAARARELLERSRSGTPFSELLRESDASVEVIDESRAVRYGRALVDAARELGVGDVGGPVTSRVGVHVVELVQRTETRLDDVRGALHTELTAGPATAVETDALRAKLFESYRYEVVR